MSDIIITATTLNFKVVYSTHSKNEGFVQRTFNKNCISSVSVPYTGDSIEVRLKNNEVLSFSLNGATATQIDNIDGTTPTDVNNFADIFAAYIL